MPFVFNPFIGNLDWAEPSGGGELPDIGNPNDGEVHLTPKASSTGVEGTIFYCSDDNHIYVGVE
jgi:hypothetical protein